MSFIFYWELKYGFVRFARFLFSLFIYFLHFTQHPSFFSYWSYSSFFGLSAFLYFLYPSGINLCSSPSLTGWPLSPPLFHCPFPFPFTLHPHFSTCPRPGQCETFPSATDSLYFLSFLVLGCTSSPAVIVFFVFLALHWSVQLNSTLPFFCMFTLQHSFMLMGILNTSLHTRHRFLLFLHSK